MIFPGERASSGGGYASFFQERVVLFGESMILWGGYASSFLGYASLFYELIVF
jgi:hypothetical protein